MSSTIVIHKVGPATARDFLKVDAHRAFVTLNLPFEGGAATLHFDDRWMLLEWLTLARREVLALPDDPSPLGPVPVPDFDAVPV